MSSILLMSITLIVHTWDNMAPWSVFTLYLILILGTCAWQSLICFACSLSNSMPPVYGNEHKHCIYFIGLSNTCTGVIFLLLGSGLLFSGICVSYTDMWSFWYWCYYGSVAALTSRSLIIASTTSTLQVQMLQSSEIMNMSLTAMFGVLIATIVVGRYVCHDK